MGNGAVAPSRYGLSTRAQRTAASRFKTIHLVGVRARGLFVTDVEIELASKKGASASREGVCSCVVLCMRLYVC
jgi:hypothetical protein